MKKPWRLKLTPIVACGKYMASNVHQVANAVKFYFIGKPVEKIKSPYESSWTTFMYLFLLHAIPMLAAIVIAVLNISGYWLGKELSGRINHNGEKQLALQLTAKCHELLIVASLTEMISTYVLRSLLLGKGLPFASFVIAFRFKDLAYLWSRDFFAICGPRYNHRALVIPFLLTVTILGVTVGPSSATGLIPRLDVWPTGEATMMLDSLPSSFWPLELTSENISPNCTNFGLGCIHPSAWNSIADNLFSYWGRETVGGATALPEQVNVPSTSSVRNLNSRLKGPINTNQPDWTVATLPHAVMSDLVNSFRFLTYPSGARRCKKTWGKGICTYQDFSWSINAVQSNVFAACRLTSIGTQSIAFPVISHNGMRSTITIPVNVSFDEHDSKSQFHWVVLPDPHALNASVGVIVRPAVNNSESNRDSFACIIQAQWANTTTQTTFGGTNYMVTGTPSGFYNPSLPGVGYKGQTVVIQPSWAGKMIQTIASNQDNLTVFDLFMNTGSGEDISSKVEAILAVMAAETMSHSGAGSIPLSITSSDVDLKRQGLLVAAADYATTTQRANYTLQTTMTGYGYGMYNSTGLSISTFISVTILLIYATIAALYLATILITQKPYIRPWRDVMDMIAVAIHSQSTAAIQNTSCGINSRRTLEQMVTLQEKNGEAQICFINTPQSRTFYVASP